MSLALLSATARLRVRAGAGGGGGGASLRTFSTPEWQFLLGPQTVPGTYVADGITNMESNLTSRASEFETRCTSVEGFIAGTGTIAVTNGSADIVGSGGADFTGLTGRGIRIPDAGFADGYRYFLIHSVQSATTAKLGVYSFGAGNVVTATWAGTSDSGLAWSVNNTASDGSNVVNDFNGVYNYYDTVLGLYQGWAKTDNFAGGSASLSAARAIADHLADTRSIGGWVLPSTGAAQESARTAALIGFACRAYDDTKTDWFDGMAAYVDAQTLSLLTREATGGAYAARPNLSFVRDTAFTLMYTAVLGVVHPNTTTRDAYRDAVIAFALDPVERKAEEFASGYVRWKNTKEGTGSGSYLTASDGSTVVDYCQPFINALMIEALIWVHRMMRFHGITSGTDYDDIGALIVKSVRGWYAGYQQSSNGYNANLRALPYFTGDAGQKEKGTTDLTVTTPPGSPFAIGATTPINWDQIVEARQRNADGLGLIGYAHALSPGAEFLDMYHEVLDSCFGDVGHSGNVTYSSLWYTIAEGGNSDGTQKNWNQHHRMCQRAPAWIVGGLETFS